MTGYWYDERAALGAVRFFERVIRHTKGEWAGQPFALQPWQRGEVIEPLFGWKRTDGTRRYRRAYIEIPRKQGKSTISSGLALLLLLADAEPGAEIYSAAADKTQASIVFDQAKQFVEGSPLLSREVRVYRNYLAVPKTNSIYRVLSADAFTKHGLNAHGIIFDELHAQPNRELWDVLATSMGARRQPLMVAITTAGYDRASICWEQHEHARQVLAGVVDDPEYFAFIAAADESDDWTSPATWYKANPSLGVTVSEDYLRGECNRAQVSPAHQNTFRRLYLNQWTQQENRWLDMRAWDACAAALPDLTGRPCYGGLDLASTTDVAAFVLAFPSVEEGEPLWLLPFFWIPQANLRERVLRDRVPYDAWARDGLVTATPGNVIDYGHIEAQIVRLAEQYDLREVAFDRWGAAQITQNLTGHGLTMVQMGQGFASMSAPSKELLRLVLSGAIGHGGNPVLRWMADNVTAEQDAAGNVKPSKAKSRQRIDGIVAAIMALDRATRHDPEAGASVYEERGIRTL
jgi:phage terminase large subunit-like protein